MTTVAYDGITLAADSQMGGPYIDPAKTKKIFRINGDLVGCAGSVADLIRFRRFLNDGKEFEPKGDIEVLVIRGGKVFWYDNALIPVPCGIPAAVGSGTAYAMGAMLAGATAKEAVKIAIRLDPDTGGRIQTATY